MDTTTANDRPDSAAAPAPSAGLPNKLVRAANGIDYAYRDTGPGPAGACRWFFSSTSAATSTAGIRR